jgi:hypothetical protein
MNFGNLTLYLTFGSYTTPDKRCPIGKREFLFPANQRSPFDKLPVGELMGLELLGTDAGLETETTAQRHREVGEVTR